MNTITTNSDNYLEEIMYYESEKNKYEEIIKEYKKYKRNNKEHLDQILTDLDTFEYMKDYYDSMLKVISLGKLEEEITKAEFSPERKPLIKIDSKIPNSSKRNFSFSSIKEMLYKLIVDDMIQNMM